MAEHPLTVDLTHYIAFRHFGARPHIRGRRILVHTIATAARDNPDLGIADLMIAYDLQESEVLAALLYYAQHQNEIDAQEAAIDSEYKQLYADNP
jgi:uncharacterized protein (DUF433 family)